MTDPKPQAKESDGDVLSNPSPPQFKNRFLDPNHPATNGGLIGLVSGGRLTPDPEKAKEQMQAALDAQQKMAQEQQAAMMANLDQQLGNLTPDQKHMYVQQYKDAFQQQQQMAEQQAKLLNSNAARRRIVRVRLISFHQASFTSLTVRPEHTLSDDCQYAIR